MLRTIRLTVTILAAFTAGAFAQGPPSAPGKGKPAAVVNGKEIPETSVERALKPVTKENKAKARVEIVNYLIENALVDHYLELLKVSVEPKEVEAGLATFKVDIAEAKQDYAKVLERMEITEADLKVEIHNQLRWEKFVTQQGTEEKLRKLFEASPEIFDGSMVKARHILITADAGDEKARAAALKKIQEIKAALDKEVAVAATMLPAEDDNLTKQKKLNKAIEDRFAAAAREHSVCRTKRDGGDLGEFPRMGMMVEPFSKAAFALKPYQISDPVPTPYGYHLILVTARKPGEAVKFELVRNAVAEVYGARLREAVVEKMKSDPNTKIEIMK
jgi:peptidyl-prolyl cis-trans isomerase C